MGRRRKSARLNPPSSSSSPLVKDEIEENDTKIELPTRLSLQNPLIVNEILQYLMYQDLMACRRVNKMWKSLSSSIIVKRDYALVKLKYNPKKRSYQKAEPQVESSSNDKVTQTTTTATTTTTTISKTPRDLQELNKFLVKPGSAADFPCTHFVFEGGNLGDDEPQKFFIGYGSKIKGLEFVNISYYCRGGPRRKKNEQKEDPSCFTTKSVFRKILLNAVPTIKSLAVTDFDFNWGEKEDLDLHLLETFSWQGCRRTALKILEGCLHLKTIQKKTLTSEDTLMIGKCRNEAALEAALRVLRARLVELELKSERLLEELGR